MTLEQLRCFLEAAYCRNFSTAAKHLYTTQPNLTKTIAAMEKELGTKLFDRTTRSVSLTPYGEQLMNRTEALFLPFLRAYEDLQRDIHNNKRAIYIGAVRGETIPRAVLEILRRRNLEQNNVRYMLRIDSHPQLNEDLQSRQCSIVISSDRNARILPGMDHLKLQPLHMMVAISKYHPLADRETLLPSDLRNETVFFSLFKGNAPPADLAQTLYHQVGTLLDIHFLNSHDDALNCVRIGAGVAILPELIDLSAYPDIRLYPFIDRMEGTAFQSLVWHGDETDPYILDLVQELRQIYENKADTPVKEQN